MSRGKEGLHDVGTPKAAAARLSLYLRYLDSLHRQGEETVSSGKLGAQIEINDAQVRKDLAYFGQFGYPGLGYKVAELRTALREVLGTNKTWKVGLIGVGNIGRALLRYRGFAERGFVITALFDQDPAIVGQRLNGLDVAPIEALPKIAAEVGLQMAIVAVPPDAVDDVTKHIAEAGIQGILNFAPTQLKTPSEINVVSVDLGLQFEQLAFQITGKRRNDVENRTGS